MSKRELKAQHHMLCRWNVRDPCQCGLTALLATAREVEALKAAAELRSENDWNAAIECCIQTLKWPGRGLDGGSEKLLRQLLSNRNALAQPRTKPPKTRAAKPTRSEVMAGVRQWLTTTTGAVGAPPPRAAKRRGRK